MLYCFIYAEILKIQKSSQNFKQHYGYFPYYTVLGLYTLPPGIGIEASCRLTAPFMLFWDGNNSPEQCLSPLLKCICLRSCLLAVQVESKVGKRLLQINEMFQMYLNVENNNLENYWFGNNKW